MTFTSLIAYVDPSCTIETNRLQMKNYAEVAFTHHTIVEEIPDRVFYCAAPGTIIHSFRVAFLPAGMIVVYGDIGDMMLQRGGEDWLRGSIRHDYVSDYVMEKVVPYRRSKEFFPGDALADLKRIHDGVPYVEDGVNLVEQARLNGKSTELDSYYEESPQPELAYRIAEDWLLSDVYGRDGEAWGLAYYKHTHDCEPPDYHDFTRNDLWCYFALSWFMRQRESRVGK